MLSRCSSAIAGALSSGRYAIPKAALRWFELHSEADVRHIRISKCGRISGSLATSSVVVISLTGAGLCQPELCILTAERHCAAGVTRSGGR